MPTVEQAMTCVRLYQWLSNYYRAIYFFRYDQNTKIVYMQAGTVDKYDEIEVIVFANGLWEFPNDEA